jgi:hypothetical protein
MGADNRRSEKDQELSKGNLTLPELSKKQQRLGIGVYQKTVAMARFGHRFE